MNASLLYADPTTSRAELPGSGGLAKGASVRAGGLSDDRIVSRPGEVRVVAPDAPGRRFHSGEHRRRFGKRSQAEKARFLNIAEGSLEECRYYLILAHDLGYGQTDSLTAMLEETSRLLNAYARAILASGS